ncbi:protein of unknown function [Chryseobacterium sp. RU37D]|uniref:DUF4304 domain-containing protein n=1 Tax=Chryseobacterium sp. RU37D TaxID=1907397 RepID=UPI000953ED48|nr:DUF4304 domain-containing protein [Chryseobacterium sp. RU37D]SIP96023.1 protein of unknown function [Chryseobacterium sp. RU37D]
MEKDFRNLLIIMDSKEFKVIFGEIAKSYGFIKAFSGWYKKNAESIAILELQKSNFGDYYQLNIKVFVQKVFNRTYEPNKDLIKSSLGHVNSSETKPYSRILNFDDHMEDNIRIELVNELFNNHIVPFINKTSSISGILNLEEAGEIFLLPAIKEELQNLQYK